MTKVTAVTLIHGDRWKFLSQIIGPVMADPHVTTLIIVDNGSSNSEDIANLASLYPGRTIHVRHEKNLGSAGGFHSGIAKAKETDCEYVLLLDDDMIPEEGYIDWYLKVESLFEKKVVLSGSRPELLENREAFYRPVLKQTAARGTFFEVFSIAKIKNFSHLIFRHATKTSRGPFVPVIPTEAFVYGGAFIPIEAVYKAELPDPSLFLYGDDVEYSWNIKKAGFDSYLCAHPVYQDIDFTFGGNQSHIFGQFDQKTAPLRVYYRMRNMVRLSRKHSLQNKMVLFLNILTWTLGLLILGFIQKGLTKAYWEKCVVLCKAVYAGYFPNSAIARAIENSFK